jgi:hypothetical protein
MHAQGPLGQQLQDLQNLQRWEGTVGGQLLVADTAPRAAACQQMGPQQARQVQLQGLERTCI